MHTDCESPRVWSWNAAPLQEIKFRVHTRAPQTHTLTPAQGDLFISQ